MLDKKYIYSFLSPFCSAPEPSTLPSSQASMKLAGRATDGAKITRHLALPKTFAEKPPPTRVFASVPRAGLSVCDVLIRASNKQKIQISHNSREACTPTAVCIFYCCYLLTHSIVFQPVGAGRLWNHRYRSQRTRWSPAELLRYYPSEKITLHLFAEKPPPCACAQGGHG